MNKREMINKLDEIKGGDFIEFQVDLVIEFLQEYFENDKERIIFVNNSYDMGRLERDIIKYEIESLLGNLENDKQSLTAAKIIAMEILNRAKEIIERD